MQTATVSWRQVLEGIRDRVLPRPPAAELLDLELLEVGQGRTLFRFSPNPGFGNPTRVHGGLLAAVADFAVSTAVATLLAPAVDVVTADLHVSFLRPVELDDPPLECEGVALHKSRTQANAQARMWTPDGSVVLHALATCRIRAHASAEVA